MKYGSDNMLKEKVFMKKNNSGFTLIELLVVISIIALLLSILMPSLAKVKTLGRETIDKANLRQWGIIFNTFLAENNGKFFKGSTLYADTSEHWNQVLLPYINEQYELSRCPMTTKIRSDIDGGLVGGTFISWGKFPGGWGGVDEYGSYGLNQWVTDEDGRPRSEGGTGRVEYEWYYRRLEKITHPDEVPMLMDSVWTGSWPKDMDSPPTEPLDKPISYVHETMSRFAIARHRGGVFCLFADSSVRHLTIKDLWSQRWHKGFDHENYWTQDRAVWPEWIEDALKGK